GSRTVRVLQQYAPTLTDRLRLRAAQPRGPHTSGGRNVMNINFKDLGAGATFIAVAATYGSIAMVTLSRGTPSNMGPATFPLILCAILALLGIGLCLRGLASKTRSVIEGHIAWRAILIICASVIF